MIILNIKHPSHSGIYVLEVPLETCFQLTIHIPHTGPALYDKRRFVLHVAVDIEPPGSESKQPHTVDTNTVADRIQPAYIIQSEPLYPGPLGDAEPEVSRQDQPLQTQLLHILPSEGLYFKFLKRPFCQFDISCLYSDRIMVNNKSKTLL